MPAQYRRVDWLGRVMLCCRWLGELGRQGDGGSGQQRHGGGEHNHLAHDVEFPNPRNVASVTLGVLVSMGRGMGTVMLVTRMQALIFAK